MQADGGLIYNAPAIAARAPPIWLSLEAPTPTPLITSRSAAIFDQDLFRPRYNVARNQMASRSGMPAWASTFALSIAGAAIALLLAVCGTVTMLYVGTITDDVSELKKDTKTIAQELSRTREGMVKVATEISTKLDGTNRRLDDAITELRSKR